MGEKIASNSGDNFSDEDFEEDQSVLKFYLNPKSMYSKSPDSQKSNISETSFEIKEQITRKVEQLTYLDLPKSDENDLKYFIDLPLKYNGTIYQCPAFAKLNLRDQVKLLCSYHTKLSKNVSNQARLQLECVPLTKIIKSSAKCPILNVVEMDKSEEENQENNNINSFDALVRSRLQDYISKSGRVTKRKFYSETVDSEMKKIKVQDGAWQNGKKTSPTIKSRGRGKKLPLEADKTLENKIISKKNVEIINRSALFKEKDTKNNRWAKILEGMEDQKMKVEEEGAKMEQFNKSLSINDEISEYIEDNDNSPVKRRVKPPAVKPKVGRSKKQKEPYAELELVTRKANYTSKPQTEKPSNVKPQVQKKIVDSFKSEAPSTSSVRKSSENMIQCPICSRDFENTKIEEHASSCGENMIETRSITSGLSNMSCRFCDEVFISDSIYEEHVKSCPMRPHANL